MNGARKPAFLIIGAMKAGTTSLYEDLARFPGIYMLPDKEPNDLVDPEIDLPSRQERYFRKFARAPEGALCGEASTSYAMRPTYEGVAVRARAILGSDLRIIYMRRDPINRIVSHYHHLWGLGLEQRPLNSAVLDDPTYVAYSSYDYQLAPWREAFPAAQILELDFERYINEHEKVLGEVAAFLGKRMPQNVVQRVRNASDGKRIVRRGSLWAKFRSTSLYLYGIKPLLSTTFRDRIKAILLPKARSMDCVMSADVRDKLMDRLGKVRAE